MPTDKQKRQQQPPEGICGHRALWFLSLASGALLLALALQGLSQSAKFGDEPARPLSTSGNEGETMRDWGLKWDDDMLVVEQRTRSDGDVNIAVRVRNSDIPANVSLARLPYSSLIDGAAVCRLGACEVLADNTKLTAVLAALGTASDVDGEARQRVVERLKTLMALIVVRRRAISLDTPPAKGTWLHRVALWANASSVSAEFDGDIGFEPEVASRCLSRTEYASYVSGTEGLARDRNALIAWLTAVPHRTFLNELRLPDPKQLALRDVAWAVGVLRTRSWLRPTPHCFGVVPLLDALDQRTGIHGGVSAAPNAAFQFDDANGVLHVVSLERLRPSQTVTVRGDYDGSSSALSALTAHRLYGIADDKQQAVVLSHAEALFRDREDLRGMGCQQVRALYFNVTTGEPSDTLQRCVAALTGNPKGARAFLAVHAKRVITELYSHAGLAGCRSLVLKRPNTRVAKQAATILAVHRATVAGLERAHDALRAKP